MKRKTGYLLILWMFSLSFITLYAQNDYNGFNLKDYFTPDIVRNALELNLQLNGNTDHVTDSVSTTSVGLNNFEIGFSRLENTRRRISTLDAQVKLNLNYQDKSNDVTHFVFGNLQSIQWYNSIYYKPKNFFSFGVNVNHNGNYDKVKEGSSYQHLYSSDNESLSATAGWGFGRIERVEDARQAIYILEDLKKNKVLSRDMTKDEIFEFSQLISTVKNKRFLDDRLHRIDEITTIDNYLKNKQILTNSDAAYFTSLYDMWDYGALFDRNAGSRFSINLTPEIRREYDNEEQTSVDQNYTSAYKNENTYLLSGAQLDFSYQHSIPVKLNWQHDFNASLSVNALNVKPDWRASPFWFFQQMGKVSYTLGYYPTTRTNVYVDVNYQIFNQTYQDSDQNDYYQIANLNGGVYYYISPNIRFSGSIGLYDQLSNYGYYSNQNNFSFGYLLSLAYLFF